MHECAAELLLLDNFWGHLEDGFRYNSDACVILE